MGETTAISWAQASWNPWVGCTKVSPGCDHCYMFRGQRKYGNDPELVRRTKTKFDLPLKLKEPSRIFACSWGDWFHEAADEWRPEAWEIVRACPQHTFMILTKRQGRIARCLPDDWGDGWPNVWLGVSIENAAQTFRARQLAEVPAALRFMSCEPLLGSLFPSDDPLELEGHPLDLSGFGWVIVGGESGFREDARPMFSTWAREIRDRVLDLEVAAGYACSGGDGHLPACGGTCGDLVLSSPRPLFHFKQVGSWAPVRRTDPREGDVWVTPDGSTVAWAGESGTRGAGTCLVRADGAELFRYAGEDPSSGGRTIDGREWLEIPGATAYV